MAFLRTILAAFAALTLSTASAQDAGGLPDAAMPDAPPAAPVPPEIPIALLVDISSGQTLFAREAERRFVPASVTKVMTAYTAFELIAAGELALDMPVPIDDRLEEEWSGEGSSMFLRSGERPTVSQLLMGTTTVSGNDATVALARAVAGSVEGWGAMMNANARALGLSDTHFGTPNGYPDEGRTFTSARDLVLLGEAIVTRHPELYEIYFGNRIFTWQGLTQENHDPVTGVVPGADGLKTGFTSEAGFTFLGSAERDGRRLMMVLAGAQTGLVRDRAARELLEWGFTNFERESLMERDVALGEAEVQDGTRPSVTLRTAEPVRITVPRGGGPEPSLTIRYRGPIVAPIAEGDRVATLRVEIAGQPPLDMPLEAAQSVEQAGFFRRMLNGLESFLG